jgi:hypothetical protein
MGIYYVKGLGSAEQQRISITAFPYLTITITKITPILCNMIEVNSEAFQ